MIMTEEKKAFFKAEAEAKGMNLYYIHFLLVTTRKPAIFAITAKDEATALENATKKIKADFQVIFRKILKIEKQ